MNRPIKFSAWHKIEEKMCRVELIKFDDAGNIVGAFLIGIIPNENQIANLLGKPVEIIAPTYGRFCDVSEFELLEFTGIKDSEGTEIYECDIIRYKLPDNHSDTMIEYIEEVKCVEGIFNVDDFPLSTASDCESRVIGNIFKNPELLNNK